jgi:hypothetical protein
MIPVRGCVSVVPIGPRVVRWYKAATGDGWIVTLAICKRLYTLYSYAVVRKSKKKQQTGNKNAKACRGV